MVKCRLQAVLYWDLNDADPLIATGMILLLSHCCINSISQLRTEYMQTLGTSELQPERTRSAGGASSLSGSIQLESLVQNKDDIERDGRVGMYVLLCCHGNHCV